jgi:hypothetical protein
MLSCCLNKQETKVVDLSEKSNSEELLGWEIPNVDANGISKYPYSSVGVNKLRDDINNLI